MIVLTQADVVRLLPMRECIKVVRDALTRLAKGEAVQPLRSGILFPDKRGVLASMPGWLKGAGAGAKLITVVFGNEGTAFDPHQGAVLLFEARRGALVCVADASSITAIRTAAATAVATDLLADQHARDLAILGSGIQAETHLAALLLVRKAKRVRVWSRTASRGRAFAGRESTRHRINVEFMPTVREAVAGADVICTATSAKQPILESAWVAAGAHVNVVGSSNPAAREVDTALIKRARVFTDRRESCLAEAGDFIIPMKEGAIGESHLLGELGDLLLRTVPARSSASDVTLFKSLGIAVEDIAAIHHIYKKALRLKAGKRIRDFGGSRDMSP
ncbi:MAG TPA: ornithine cyclodeaminase family protein [Gemmatimonadales bacterium]